MELTIAQFIEQYAAAPGPDILRAHRTEVAHTFAQLPINRTTKRVLDSINIPLVAATFASQMHESQALYAPTDDTISVTPYPAAYTLLPIASTAPLSERFTTPLMQIADLVWNTGSVLTIPRGTVSTVPIILPTTAAAGDWPLTRIIVEPECSVTLIESHIDPARATVRAYSTEIIIGAHSTVQLLSLVDQTESPVQSLATTRIRLERDARITWLSALFGGTSGRYETEITAAAPGAHIDQRLLHLTNSAEQLHVTCGLVHDARETSSRLRGRGAVGGTSYVRFEGTIRITPGSQLTDAALEEKTLFLSDTARHDSVPALEIDADDVKATHSSSVSKLDTEQMFYATSRGIAPADARAMITDGMLRELTEGFCADIVSLVDTRLTHHLHGTVDTE